MTGVAVNPQPRPTVASQAQPRIDTDPSGTVPGKQGRTDHPSGPRAGALTKLGEVARKVMNSIAAALPTARRLRSLQQAQAQFRALLLDTPTALTAPKANADTIEAALTRAGLAARALQRAGGDPRKEIEALIGGFVRTADDRQLSKLVAAFGSDAVGQAQARLTERPQAARLLLEMQRQVNTELTSRIDSVAGNAIGAALASVQNGSSRQRIADKIHFAFDSAVPLVKLGVLRSGEATDAAIDAVVLNQLATLLLPADLAALLRNMHSEDLARLARTGTATHPPALLAALQAVEAEIQARPHRLEEELATRVREFNSRYPPLPGPPTRLDRDAFVRDLAAAGDLVHELQAHREIHELPSPGRDRSRDLLRARVSALLSSGQIDLEGSSPRALMAVSTAAGRLGGPQSLITRTRDQREALIAARMETYRLNVSPVLEKLRGGADPGSLLPALERLAEASISMKSARDILDSDTKVPRPPADAAGTESEVLADVIGALPAQDRVALALAMLDPQTQALVSALHVGAGLAFDAREANMGQRFANMAHLLEQVGREASAWLAQTAPAVRGDSHFAAARHLSEPGRQAFRNRYALVLPTEGAPTLQAGRFTAAQEQRMRTVLERPLSRDEHRLTKLGDYEVGNSFYQDAIRASTYRVSRRPARQPAIGGTPVEPDTGSPLRPLSRGDGTAPAADTELMIDTHDWPVARRESADEKKLRPDERVQLARQRSDRETQEREARVAAGFERLVELCGGNEEQARTLTLFGHQGLMAGFFAVGAANDSPLRLSDGTVGGTIHTRLSGGEERTEIGFSIGANGRPQIDVDYGLIGRNTFKDFKAKTDPKSRTAPEIVLSPDSRLQLHFRLELREDNTLVLLEAPSYRFDLRPDEFQKPYPPPTAHSIGKETEDSDLVRDVLRYSRQVGVDHEIHALRALDRLEGATEPTLSDAAAVVSACDGGPRGARQGLMSNEARVAFGQAMRSAHGGLVAAFDEALAEANRMANEVYSQNRARLAARPDWPPRYPVPETFAALVQQAKGGDEEAFAAYCAFEEQIRAAHSAEILDFVDGLDELKRDTGPDSFARAETLYRKFVAPPTTAARFGPRGAGSSPLNLSSEAAAEVRRRLDEQRQTRFDPGAFNGLKQTLVARIETDVLPGMIQAVRTGEL